HAQPADHGEDDDDDPAHATPPAIRGKRRHPSAFGLAAAAAAVAAPVTAAGGAVEPGSETVEAAEIDGAEVEAEPAVEIGGNVESVAGSQAESLGQLLVVRPQLLDHQDRAPRRRRQRR